MPTISLVTPSFNQGRFLEEAIRSVLLQGYPKLEYILMDGGSTDESVSIMEHYAPFLAHWQTGRDGGQAEAIARGFERASGDIFGWINSDDFLLPRSLERVGRYFARNPQVTVLIGGGLAVDEGGGLIRKIYSLPQGYPSLLFGGEFFLQMATFWRRDAYERVGGLDTSLRFCFDYDLFLRLVRERPPGGIDAMLAAFRLHGGSKTSTIWNEVALPEIARIRSRHDWDNVDQVVRDREARSTIDRFYSATRAGILKDVVRDPSYFARCLMNKVAGRPGSNLLGIHPDSEGTER